MIMKYPKRKHIRLKEYDYSQNGYYYITICAYEKKCIFGSVGRGLAPATAGMQDIHLSPLGETAEEQLFALELRYPFVRIDKYIIMPNHLHFVLVLDGKTAGASPRPTLSDIICAYKSLTTRLYNQRYKLTNNKIFQSSFYEHIIRNEKDYLAVWQYIDENPRKWENDEYYK